MGLLQPPSPGKKKQPVLGEVIVVPPGEAHGHVHGPGCGHDPGHEHGPSCGHGHDHDHGTCGHDHGREAEEREPGTRPSEEGGTACQLDLELVIPGETDEIGRFQKLERLLEAHRGVYKIHLRQDLGHAEVCVHYDPKNIRLMQVIGLLRTGGAEVSGRYKQKTWFVRGMDCAQCGYVIEYVLNRAKGVLQASVGYAGERLVVEYDSEVCGEKDIERRVDALGYELEPVDAAAGGCRCHAHGGGLAPRLEMPLAIASGILLAAGFALERLGVPRAIAILLYSASGICGGWYAIRTAISSVKELHFDIDTLMIVGAFGAAGLGHWEDAALLLFLFSLGHALEHRAMERARRAIEALAKLRPETARVRREGGELVEVPVAKVKRGDRIAIRPGDRVPLDGKIVEGRSALDQAAITGESVPVAKGPGDEVFAGTINAEAALEVEVTKLATESALARVIEMVAEAEAQKSPTQRFTQRLERRFVPVILFGAPVLLLVLWAVVKLPLDVAVLRTLSMLVAASPCALAISTPSAVLSAVARAARGGVLMKGGAHLESLGKVAAIAFDKTGTLTVGKPRLITVAPAPGADETRLLATAAGAEALSSHPLALAIVAGAKGRGVQAEKAAGLEAVHGRGIRSSIAGEPVAVGSLALFDGAAPPGEVVGKVHELEAAGQTTMIVKRGDRFLGVIGVADTLRPEAKAALGEIRRLGIERTVMLSGDNNRVARAIGHEVGIDETRAPLMPEGKVLALRELAKEGGVAMVGDGVNDAPALAAASVGVAMGGAGSDVALETADVVLMSDDLSRLPFAVGLARAASRVVRQNLVISLGVSACLVVAAIGGQVEIGAAVVLHEGSTLVVVFNALRLLAFRG